MKYLLTAILTTSLMGGGIGLATLSMADQHKMKGMHGGHHGMHHGGGWKASLTDDQQKQIDKLKLDYKKKMYPIKAKLKQAKIEKALLMTTDSPNQSEIDKKIDAILKLKGQKMRLKTAHKIAVRKVLTKDQRVHFDMKLLKHAYHGKKYKGRGHH